MATLQHLTLCTFSRECKGLCFCGQFFQLSICLHFDHYYMTHVMRKPAFFKCQDKGANQPYGNYTADQCLCFRYIANTIPLLSKSEISSLYSSSHLLWVYMYSTICVGSVQKPRRSLRGQEVKLPAL